ncbi:hypothetical protein IY145_05215 [Methylosinus sp. H3A]|uniref:hypothetical protein n=1 Tax=Methylosinus sp. H3A TaxID=2785786 RepID=UPI0018C2668E|nr:hypothetical protein [Methylosinus sp. H3A]MBG0808768.1 hypothetical protein [Methylosinus sp. H3A]
MTLPAPPTGLYPEDYERIEDAVMETVRGRWFLLEFARRQRAQETERLIVAVDRLERVAARAEEQEAAADWRLPRRLVERAQEFAQTLRASGVDATLCAQADALVEQFSRLLDSPPAAMEETPRVIAEAAPGEIVADYVELTEPPGVIEPIEVEQIEICAEPLAIDAEPIETAPVVEEPETAAQLEEERPTIALVDAPTIVEAPAPNGIVFEEFVARAILPDEIARPKPAPARPIDPRLVALSRLDHLSLNEKLRLFG